MYETGNVLQKVYGELLAQVGFKPTSMRIITRRICQLIFTISIYLKKSVLSEETKRNITKQIKHFDVD